MNFFRQCFYYYVISPLTCMFGSLKFAERSFFSCGFLKIFAGKFSITARYIVRILEMPWRMPACGWCILRLPFGESVHGWVSTVTIQGLQSGCLFAKITTEFRFYGESVLRCCYALLPCRSVLLLALSRRRFHFSDKVWLRFAFWFLKFDGDGGCWYCHVI